MPDGQPVPVEPQPDPNASDLGSQIDQGTADPMPTPTEEPPPPPWQTDAVTEPAPPDDAA